MRSPFLCLDLRCITLHFSLARGVTDRPPRRAASLHSSFGSKPWAHAEHPNKLERVVDLGRLAGAWINGSAGGAVGWSPHEARLALDGVHIERVRWQRGRYLRAPHPLMLVKKDRNKCSCSNRCACGRQGGAPSSSRRTASPACQRACGPSSTCLRGHGAAVHWAACSRRAARGMAARQRDMSPIAASRMRRRRGGGSGADRFGRRRCAGVWWSARWTRGRDEGAQQPGLGRPVAAGVHFAPMPDVSG